MEGPLRSSKIVKLELPVDISFKASEVGDQRSQMKALSSGLERANVTRIQKLYLRAQVDNVSCL